MSNKNFKYIFVVLTIFCSFFIGGKEVKAEEYYDCQYISHLSYIDNSNRATLVDINIGFQDVTRYTVFFAFHQIGASTTYRTMNLEALCLNERSSKLYLGFKLTEPLVSDTTDDSGGRNSISQQIFSFEDSIDSAEIDSQYVKIYDYSSGKYQMTTATEEEYKNYVKSQYNDISTDASKYTLYNPVSISAGVADKWFINESDCVDQCDGDCTARGICLLDDSSSFRKFMVSGSAVFVNTDYAETYPSTNWNKFKSLLNRATRDVTDEEIEGGIGTIIDTGTKDTITYTKAFYDATNTLWSTFMGDNPSGVSATDQKRSYFAYWYTKSVARYTFEEDYNKFLRYWKYIYYDECSGSNCDLNEDGDAATDKDKEIYYSVIEILELMDDADDVDDCQSTNSNNPCVSICANTCEAMQNSSLISACSQSSTYTTCSECTSECSNRCQNIGSASDKEKCKTTCYDKCTNDAYSTLEQELDDEEQAIADKLADEVATLYNLTKASAPTLSGVNFGSYKVDCNDVSFLHTFYNIMRILAPILVILFGTLDYTKSVMGADEQKILEARKKFPKRILLLVLLILIPFIISAILSLADIDTSLITCILNGE